MHHLAGPLKLNLQTRALATDANICRNAGALLKRAHVKHTAARQCFDFAGHVHHCEDLFTCFMTSADGMVKEGNDAQERACRSAITADWSLLVCVITILKDVLHKNHLFAFPILTFAVFGF